MSPEELHYSVVVCPRCREHAQIIETGKKTVSCQHCGARLRARKLRVFYSSDELEKAVAARTRLQAEISGKGEKLFTGNLSQESGNSDFGTGTERKFPVNPSGRPSNPPNLKKDPRKVILETLETAGGEMEIGKLRENILEKDPDPEKFEETLKKLRETGEIYSPARGKIKIV
ncbi:TPA: hypothetical protein HA351_10885 [Methanosarcinaceae archaeon]|nr:hypothetical protein [Methanosarcinaceae archaeon]